MTVRDSETGFEEALSLDDLWEGDMLGVEVGGAKVLLVNVDGAVRAYENKCPHQNWELSEGDFDGVTITCMRHSWEFDALSGTGVNPVDSCLKRFDCQVDDDGTILVRVTGSAD